MSREIKFRARRKGGSEWRYFRLPDMIALDYNPDEWDNWCEYTGLKDKNGKEIYEGDIVKTDEAGWIAKVIYNRDGFMCTDERGGFSYECAWERFEVIGNIYKNPELLKTN